MDYPWLKHYPTGVPTEIDPDTFPHLPAVLDQAARRFDSRPASAFLGASLSFRDLRQAAWDLAAYLQAHCDCQPGDRIALALPNCFGYLVGLWASLYAGATIVNLNPLYNPREMAEQLRDAEVKIAIGFTLTLKNLASAVQQSPVTHLIVSDLDDLIPPPRAWLLRAVSRYRCWRTQIEIPLTAISLSEALEVGKKAHYQPVSLTQDDLAFLQYTGGTTGKSKGAMLTHGNLIANALQAYEWLKPVLDDDGTTIMITPLPLYHVFSLTCNCFALTLFGGCSVLILDPRNIKSFINTLRRYRFTAITAVNTLYNALLNAPGFDRLDFSSLRAAIAGGMALQPSVAEHWHRVTGKPVLEGYGLTECSPIVTVNPPVGNIFSGSIGLPLSSTQISIRNDEDEALPCEEVGELCVKGPQVMKGYWQLPEADQEIFTPSGWLRSGDLATMDAEGFVRIVDRKKDMILVSGFNVYPNEVEAVIAGHPAVLEAAVVGMKSSEGEESVRAVVVKRNATLTEETLRVYCRQHLTAYKVPSQIEFRDSLPKTPVGKILRRAL